MKEIKDKIINIRITAQEKEEITAHAKRAGFDNITSFLLWLFRKYGKE